MLACIPMVPIAMINGAIRNIVYCPYMSELIAHKGSSVTRALLNKRWRVESTYARVQLDVQLREY